MKKSVYTVMAVLFFSSVGTTNITWSEEISLMAQAGSMEKKMHGADKPQMKPMGEMKHGMKMEMATEGTVEGVGEVIALVPELSQIVVDHEEIPGFMAAMTMGYPVKPAKLLQGLKQGDKIRFTIDTKEKAIVKIIRIKHAAPGTQGKDRSHRNKMPPRSSLKPAEGASVKILSPRNDHTVSGSYVNIRFKLIKGKIGSHVHVYVDEELMGMFSPDEGSLTGQGAVIDVQPGRRALELRVVTKTHTELDATDRAHFVVK